MFQKQSRRREFSKPQKRRKEAVEEEWLPLFWNTRVLEAQIVFLKEEANARTASSFLEETVCFRRTLLGVSKRYYLCLLFFQKAQEKELQKRTRVFQNRVGCYSCSSETHLCKRCCLFQNRRTKKEEWLPKFFFFLTEANYFLMLCFWNTRVLKHTVWKKTQRVFYKHSVFQETLGVFCCLFQNRVGSFVHFLFI